MAENSRNRRGGHSSGDSSRFADKEQDASIRRRKKSVIQKIVRDIIAIKQVECADQIDATYTISAQ